MNLANKITIFRILLIPLFIACILYYGPHREYLRFYAFGIFILATISDAVDGAIARFCNQVTELGRVLDPIADKLLIISAFISLAMIKVVPEDLRIPAWAVLTGIRSRSTASAPALLLKSSQPSVQNRGMPGRCWEVIARKRRRN